MGYEAVASGKLDAFIFDRTLDDMFDRWVRQNNDQMPAIEADDDRKENFNFSDTFFEKKEDIMVRSEMKDSENRENETTACDYHQMNGKRIGTLTGSFFDQVILENLPDAVIFYFDTTTDLLTALKSQKIDAMIFNEATIKYMKSQGEQLKILDGILMEVENAAIFPNNEEGRTLETQYSEYLKKLWADGTITMLDEKWFSPDETQKTIIDYKNLPDTNGTLTLAVDPVMAPFCYIKDNLVTGYEVEIAADFCEEYGYQLNIQTMSFGSIIPAVVNGKADFASSAITITAERAESVLFSEPVYKDSWIFVVLSDSAAVMPDTQTDTSAEENSLPKNEDTSATCRKPEKR